MKASASAPNLGNTAMAKLKAKYAQAGPAYFKNTVVGSSRGFFQVQGQILAKPHFTGAVQASRRSASVGNSEYKAEFGVKRECYSSMDNKPLVKYDPLAYRSRNAVEDHRQRKGNHSSVTFDMGLFVAKKRQFYTTNSQYYQGNPVAVISNPGILAEQYRITKTDRQK